eukprot:TRINITY_DN8965_c0_g1_i1.p1 TRINITY_DN8965_c0_g1~~TRINITY_DN8965_c0_g1_i1.p1  ORF type:complete len:324 (-),score=61.42 TRINITY_DN8965_c0_g1_i1:329-1300(-)
MTAHHVPLWMVLCLMVIVAALTHFLSTRDNTLSPVEYRYGNVVDDGDQPLAVHDELPAAAALPQASQHPCETYYSSKKEGFFMKSTPTKLKQMGLVSKKEFILCPGAGTTATRGLLDVLCTLGVPSLHFEAMCHLNQSYAQGRHFPRTGLVAPKGGGYVPHESPANISSVLKDAVPSQEVVDDVLRRVFRVVDDSSVRAWMDTPTTELFWDLFNMFPKAKVILTVRDVDSWAKKRAKQHPRQHSFMPLLEPFGQLFLDTFTPQQRAFQLLLLHNTILCIVPRDRLLVVDFFNDSEDEIMKQVADFLKLEKTDWQKSDIDHIYN